MVQFISYLRKNSRKTQMLYLFLLCIYINFADSSVSDTCKQSFQTQLKTSKQATKKKVKKKSKRYSKKQLTDILSALDDHDLEAIKSLHQSGLDLEGKSKHGQTLLNIAAFKRANSNIFKYLIEEGANINTRDGFQMTPLHWLAQSGSNSIQYFIEKGADVHTTNHLRQTPFHLVGNRHLGNQYTNIYSTPTHRMTPHPPDADYSNTIRQLIKAGTDQAAVDIYGNTPIYSHALSGISISINDTHHFNNSLLEENHSDNQLIDEHPWDDSFLHQK